MANLTRWDPLRDMVTMRQVFDRVFEDSFNAPSSFAGAAGTAIDMVETGGEVIVKAVMPGIRPEDADISVSGDVLTIKGQTARQDYGQEANYLFSEIGYGSYSRSITLPVSVNPDRAEASFENGVLTLVLPKIEEVKPKQIKVKSTRMIEGKKA